MSWQKVDLSDIAYEVAQLRDSLLNVLRGSNLRGGGSSSSSSSSGGEEDDYDDDDDETEEKETAADGDEIADKEEREQQKDGEAAEKEAAKKEAEGEEEEKEEEKEELEEKTKKPEKSQERAKPISVVPPEALTIIVNMMKRSGKSSYMIEEVVRCPRKQLGTPACAFGWSWCPELKFRTTQVAALEDGELDRSEAQLVR